MSDAKIVLSDADLQTLAQAALQGQGMTPDDAASAARILVLADLFGISTHGVDRIPAYASRMQVGGINPRPAISITAATPAILRVDGDNGPGPLVGIRALQATMEAARLHGLAAAFVSGSNHFGPISPYSYIAASEGFAAIICSNATTTIAPWGGQEAKLGNNPLGVSVPFAGGDALMLDMAMSVVARAKIRRAASNGDPIPSTWATDRNGRPTTDAATALGGFLAPIGEHKGYGLALMVDLLAGLMSGGAYLTHVSSWLDAPDKPQNLGHFFLLIDTKQLGVTQEWLATRMEDFTRIVRETPPSDPDRPVLLPGEIEMERFRLQTSEGIGIPARLLETLKSLAAVDGTGGKAG